MRRFKKCLAHTLGHEGGWSDHPADPGRATMKGVTIGVFGAFKGRKVSKDELRNISGADLRAIYRRDYWDKVRGDDLPPGVDMAVFDAAVNSGPAQAARWLQRSVGAAADGKIGPETLRLVGEHPPRKVINEVCDRRMSMLRGLATWPTFGRGWSNRVSSVRITALEMVSASPPARRGLLEVFKSIWGRRA